jgi:hypothetical protein
MTKTPRRRARPDPKTLTADVRAGRRRQRVHINIPTTLLREIDREATRIGVTRQEWITIRVADALPRTKATR